MKNIYIYSAPVHSGKTTFLFQWIASQKNVKGILQPVIENKRFIYHITTRVLNELEISSDKLDKLISIGKYNFSKETFLWSQEILIDDFYSGYNWLIIDEVGPLELNGKGLEPALSKILIDRETNDGNILCVVRDSLVNKFIKHYNLENQYEIMKF